MLLLFYLMVSVFMLFLGFLSGTVVGFIVYDLLVEEHIAPLANTLAKDANVFTLVGCSF